MTSKQVNISQSRSRISCWAVILLLAIHAAACGKNDQQQTKTSAQDKPSTAPVSTQQATPAPPGAPTPAMQQPPAPPPGTKALTSIESLVAPIALYPDPLLAEVLVASTYPLEVVQAARWLETKPDPATVRGKNWDASIARLTAVPSVIAMMDSHLDWTTQLGDAFLSQPSEVMDAVQTLRKRATDAGFLKDTEQQKVEAKTVSLPEPAPSQVQGTETKAIPAVLTKEVITIEPAKADTLAVPSYNPEVVYAAPLAPPPATATGYAATPAAYPYPQAAPPPPSYYPTYYPPAETTSSSSDDWMTFGAGTVVGGLLTWGLMEWADDDDWDDDYPVGHYYGDAVCHGGNCWSGGGGGAYYGGNYNNINVDRGDINVDRDTDISGNRVNFNRDGTFKPEQLPAMKGRTDRWKPDSRHRRGQPYPQPVENRLGRMQQPALAGNRLSGVQTLPADMRGFGNAAAGRPAQPRLSSADIQRQLAAKPGTASSARGKTEALGRTQAGSRENALEGLRTSGQKTNIESKRGTSSLNQRQAAARSSSQKTLAKARPVQPERKAMESRQSPQRDLRQSSSSAQRLNEQRNREAQRLESQRRMETSRPTAFGSARDAGRSSDFSNRGNTSRMRAESGRQGGVSGGARAAGGGHAAAGSGRTASGGAAAGGRGGSRRR